MYTANKRDLLSARIMLPRNGLWTAELTVDAAEGPPLSGDVLLNLDGVELHGHVMHGGDFAGRGGALVVGGKSGLVTLLAPRYYDNPSAGLVLRELLQESGEQLSAKSDTSFTTTTLAHWTRLGGLAYSALRAIANALGAVWRADPDGSIIITRDSFPEQALEHRLLDEHPGEARATIASDTPELQPGVTFLGRRVDQVVHTLEGGRVRTEVFWESAAYPTGRGFLALFHLVDKAIGHLDYHGLYRATVVRCHADEQTLELKPDDPRLPPLTDVPMRHGLPGCKVDVPKGAPVLVGFEGGDPSAPYAGLWSAGSAMTLVQMGSDGGSQFVALENLVAVELNEVKSAIDTLDQKLVAHQHLSAAPGSATAPFLPPGAAPSQTPTIPNVKWTNYTVGEVGATKVKAE